MNAQHRYQEFAQPADRVLSTFRFDHPSGPRSATAVAHPQAAGTVLHVNADFSQDGAWTGVRDVVERAYLDLRRRGEHALIERHHYELNRVLSRYRDQLPLKYACLTDTAEDLERTRNYPLDRAYRLVHGLVGFVLGWKSTVAPDTAWTVVVGNFDRAQHLGARFFAELARRGEAADIRVLVDTAHDAETIVARFPRMRIEPGSETLAGFGLLPHTPRQPDEEDRIVIETRLQAHDIHEWEEHYPVLLAHYRRQGQDLDAAKVAMRALCISNHYGYYHESASFADTVLRHFDEIVGDDEVTRWDYLGNLFTGMATTGREEEALRMLLERAEPVLSNPEYRARMHYLISMAYLRYLKTPDLAKAETHILKAVESIEAAKDTARRDDYLFLKVFIDNGLAFLRVRQGRQQEALELCQAGYALLTRELGEERHRLHRSVLQYNSAQVYMMLNLQEEAMRHYRKSVEMDPHYSEYYNEMGNILQRQERFEEADAMYARAIEFSPPYAEVYFNKGICLLGLGRQEEAVACFDISLELNPMQAELYVLRGELHDMAERIDRSLADYDAAIALSPDTVPARVNRAVLHYNAGHYEHALADMDHVIRIDGEDGGHYANRAEIHKAMRRDDLYRRDLEMASARGAA